ncbi:pyridoxamine 5'-phosphate oxidase family protein [Streptomyces mangrovi]|uniref:pyridoxamine 5'-phosphate oxidase family protein n=1 Tax=Streptomyces mangrovi TaxID=1206892 RepID=UPI00399C6E5B
MNHDVDATEAVDATMTLRTVRPARTVPVPDRTGPARPARPAWAVDEPEDTAPAGFAPAPAPFPATVPAPAPEPAPGLDPGPGPEPVRPGSDGEHAMQRRLGTTERADRFYGEQMLDHLNERMREFIGRQEMFFLATADRHGECDNSFRAGPPGFLHVIDERTLVYPEYRGNGVHASLGNIQENPHLGILLVDFFQARIGLHVNGRAEIVEDAELRQAHPDLPSDSVPGRRALVWVRVTVEEAYIHCAKHIPHLQRAPKGTPRDWGTDDQRRKGGDFFGTAQAARRHGGPAVRPPREHDRPGVPGGPAGHVPPSDDPAAWRAHAEQLLDKARRRRAEGERTPFRGWFG